MLFIIIIQIKWKAHQIKDYGDNYYLKMEFLIFWWAFTSPPPLPFIKSFSYVSKDLNLWKSNEHIKKALIRVSNEIIVWVRIGLKWMVTIFSFIKNPSKKRSKFICIWWCNHDSTTPLHAYRFPWINMKLIKFVLILYAVHIFAALPNWMLVPLVDKRHYEQVIKWMRSIIN